MDVVEFDRILKRASGLAGAARAELLAQALDLVRGVPLAAFGTWNFAVDERNRLDAVIERTAAELAAWRRADKDLAGADLALRAGLRGYKLSIQLCDERLRIAKAGGPVPYEQVRRRPGPTSGSCSACSRRRGRRARRNRRRARGAVGRRGTGAACAPGFPTTLPAEFPTPGFLRRRRRRIGPGQRPFPARWERRWEPPGAEFSSAPVPSGVAREDSGRQAQSHRAGCRWRRIAALLLGP